MRNKEALHEATIQGGATILNMRLLFKATGYLYGVWGVVALFVPAWPVITTKHHCQVLLKSRTTHLDQKRGGTLNKAHLCSSLKADMRSVSPNSGYRNKTGHTRRPSGSKCTISPVGWEPSNISSTGGVCGPSSLPSRDTDWDNWIPRPCGHTSHMTTICDDYASQKYPLPYTLVFNNPLPCSTTLPLWLPAASSFLPPWLW